MNHANLLAQIDLLAQPSAGSSNNKPSFYKALRAVVELHKPDPKWGNCMGCQETDGGWYDNCPTIQAIKKELK